VINFTTCGEKVIFIIVTWPIQHQILTNVKEHDYIGVLNSVKKGDAMMHTRRLSGEY